MNLADKTDKIRKLKASRITPTWKLQPEILLCSNIPKPMHGVAPRVVLGAQWWNTTRQKAYASTSYHCLACGVWKHDAQYRKWMEGHELYKIDYARGRMIYLKTVPLCHFCHNYIHDGRLKMLLETGQINHAKYVAIIQHGDSILAKAGLHRPSSHEREAIIQRKIKRKQVAPWKKWRLVINRVEYPPKFKSLAAWEKEMRYGV